MTVTYQCSVDGCDFSGTELRTARHVFDNHTDHNQTFHQRRDRMREILSASRPAVIDEAMPPLPGAMRRMSYDYSHGDIW